MAAKMVEWTLQIGALPKEKRNKFLEALDTLLSWEFFVKEYGWTGLNALRFLFKEYDKSVKTGEHILESMKGVSKDDV